MNMRKKALLFALIMCIITGCKQNQQTCAAYASQCDEIYSDYNCDIQPRILTTPQYPYGSAPMYSPVYYNVNKTVYRYDFYGNQLQPNEYNSRDINGRPTVGNTTRPNVPSTVKPERNKPQAKRSRQ